MLVLVGLVSCSQDKIGTPTTADTLDSDADTDSEVDTGTSDSADTGACVERPLASAGPDLTVDLGAGSVQMDGSATGGCGPYQFAWELLALPSGSAATNEDLDDCQAEDPTFTPDFAGTYVLSLRVSDGTRESAPDTVDVLVRG